MARNTDRKLLLLLNLIPIIAVFPAINFMKPEYGVLGIGMLLIGLLSFAVGVLLIGQSIAVRRTVLYSMGNLLIGMLGALAFTAALSGGFWTPWTDGMSVLCGVATNVYYLRLPQAHITEKQA